jgi:hypothetical protein
MDQTLHHIPMRHFSAVMMEIQRVLKQDGRVIAIREPFLTPLPLYKNYKRNRFGLHEKQYGVTENIFTKKEWRRLLEATGFTVFFIRDALRPNKRSNFKNIVKNLILRLGLTQIYLYFYPNYVIILAKHRNFI